MKVYMVRSDGTDEAYLAETFAEAVAEALRVINEENPPETLIPEPRPYDETDIEQVVLVGEIKNWLRPLPSGA